MSRRSSAITAAGIVLSQPLIATSASNWWALATSSIESAISSRETSEARMPAVPIVIPSEIALVLSSIGVPARALALPAREALQITTDEVRVDLATGQMHVGVVDQAALVGRQRHPLGEHVVGVGQPRAAVGSRVVREGDAVLVEQQTAVRDEGDDRPVRIDQVGVRGTLSSALAERAPHAQEAEVAVHRPVLGVDAR